MIPRRKDGDVVHSKLAQHGGLRGGGSSGCGGGSGRRKK